MDPEYDWREALEGIMRLGKNSDAWEPLSSYIEALVREVQEWTDTASDNGTALDLACDQLAAMGHEEGGPEFMEDWRDLFMGQVAGAKAVIRDALDNYDETAGTREECVRCGHRECMTGCGADALYGCNAEDCATEANHVE